MRQEAELWLQHRALWDWNGALGLAEKRDWGDRRRKYKVSPYSEGFCWNPGKLVSEATCHLPAELAHSTKPGLDSTLCLCPERGAIPKGPWILPFLVRVSYWEIRGFLSRPKAITVINAFIPPRHWLTQYLLTARFILTRLPWLQNLQDTIPTQGLRISVTGR